MTKLNSIPAEYLESGTFIAGEEDCFDAGFKPGTPAIVLTEDAFQNLVSLATEVERHIEQKFKRRGWTTGKKQWEQELLALAKVALGKPVPKTVDRYGEPVK